MDVCDIGRLKVLQWMAYRSPTRAIFDATCTSSSAIHSDFNRVCGRQTFYIADTPESRQWVSMTRDQNVNSYRTCHFIRTPIPLSNSRILGHPQAHLTTLSFRKKCLSTKYQEELTQIARPPVKPFSQSSIPTTNFSKWNGTIVKR